MHLTVTPKCPDCRTRDGIHRIEYGANARCGMGRYVVADQEALADSPRWGCVTCGWHLPQWWAAHRGSIADVRDTAPYDQAADAAPPAETYVTPSPAVASHAVVENATALTESHSAVA